LCGTSARLAAHNAGERLDALLVGDHAHAVVERVGLAVERGEGLAGAGTTHHETALHLRGVEHVQRAAAVVGHEVGDIDQGIDRPQADRNQTPLQPLRARTVLDAAHEAERKRGTERRGRPEIERDADRARERSRNRLDRRGFQCPHVRGREIARDAADAGAVGPIGGEVDLDHRVVEPGPRSVALADRRVRGQIDDAFVVVGNLQLELRHQHAAAFDAADLADAERQVLARNE
jgi:hypothetical protein